MYKHCKYCNKEFYKTQNRSRKSWFEAKYCSHSCNSKARIVTQETRIKLSKLRTKERNPNWKGGKPKCVDCQQLVSFYAKRCNTHAFALRKGANTWNWKGGKIKKNCFTCLKEILVWPFRDKVRNFCSSTCSLRNLGRRQRGENNPMYGKEGALSPRWKGGITPINQKIRHSTEYILWRTAVLMRDDYTCQECGIKGGELQADHIKPFSLYPELRFAIDNGRTLCKPCHLQTDTWGGRISSYAT